MIYPYVLVKTPPEVYLKIEDLLKQSGHTYAIDFVPEGKVLDLRGFGLLLEKTPLDPGGAPKIRPTVLELHMIRALNQTKAWLDDPSRAAFPDDLRMLIDASLLAYELRRFT